MIIFIHVGGFYAAVEQADDPSLRGQPVLVGGDPRKRGLVTGASVEAERLGAKAGMRMAEALERCPSAAVRQTRLQRYREMAQEVRALLWNVASALETEGLEGAYLEAPAEREPAGYAAEICVRVRAELGLSAAAGIGPTRFTAFIAAAYPPPEGIRLVTREDAVEFLAPYPTTDVWGLGPTTARKLAEHGIESIGDLQKCSVDELRALVGRNAATFRALARAEDRDLLRPSPRVKSLSQERTLDEPTVDLRTLGERLADLATRLETMLDRERRAARTVGITLSYVDERRVTRSVTLPRPVRAYAEIRDAALELLNRTQAGVRAVRRVRLQLSNLDGSEPSEDPRQLRLF